MAMAWYYTDVYHRVLSYSGTFVYQQWSFSPETPHGAWEFHETLILNSPKKPLRIWMHVSDRDIFITRDTLTTRSSPMSAWPRLWPPRGILTSLSLRRTLCTATVRREGADPAPGAGVCMAGIRTQEVNRQQITRSSADSTRVVGHWEVEIC